MDKSLKCNLYILKILLFCDDGIIGSDKADIFWGNRSVTNLQIELAICPVKNIYYIANSFFIAKWNSPVELKKILAEH